MADKKITIKPDDMERLRELMRQEEEKLDAANPSDAELSEWEDRLEDSVRKLAQKTPGSLPSVTDEMDRNWAALQQKMQSAARPAPEAHKSADVLPLTPRRSKNRMLPWIGMVAAAALVLIMVRPKTDDNGQTMNDQNVQIKGNATSTMTADCELDVASIDGSSVTAAADGQGFVGNAGTEVEVSMRCSHSGFMLTELQGPTSEKLVTPVSEGQRQRILRDGQTAKITLQSGQPWSLALVLIDKDPARTDGTQEHILWQDKITVRARE